MTIGLWTRVATVTTFAVVAGNLLLSQTHFRHNRAFLAIVLGGLALLPAGRVLSVDAWWRRRRGRVGLPTSRALWPLWLLRAQVCLVYLASGISKLVDPDWFGGLVLWDRVVRYQYVLEPTPLPDWAVDLLTERWLYYVVGPAAVFTELFIGVGLWFGRTRLAAVWVAFVFHLLIEVSASVEVFSYVAIAALAIWVTPSTRDRIVRVGGDAATSRVVIALVRAGDWFGRFDVVRAAPPEPVITVVDRDGTVHTGADAVSLLLSRSPAHVPGGRAGTAPDATPSAAAPARRWPCEGAHPGRLGGRVVGRHVRGAPPQRPGAGGLPGCTPRRPRGVRCRRCRVARAISGRRRSLRLRVRPGRPTGSSPGYNIVRHAGVTMSLYQLARAGHPEVLGTADAALAVMLDSLVPAGDGMAFVENDRSARLGASALMAAALAQRRDATGDDTLRRRVAGVGSVPRRPDHDRRADAQHVRPPGRGAGTG